MPGALPSVIPMPVRPAGVGHRLRCSSAPDFFCVHIPIIYQAGCAGLPGLVGLVFSFFIDGFLRLSQRVEMAVMINPTTKTDKDITTNCPVGLPKKLRRCCIFFNLAAHSLAGNFACMRLTTHV